MRLSDNVYQKLYSLELRTRIFFRTFIELSRARKANKQSTKAQERYHDYVIGQKNNQLPTMTDYLLQTRVARKLRCAGYVVTELPHATIRIYARAYR